MVSVMSAPLRYADFTINPTTSGIQAITSTALYGPHVFQPA